MKITKERAIEIAERITVNWRIPFSRSDIRYREAEIELWTSYYNIESSTKFENPVWAITQTWERQSDGLNDSYTVFVDSETGAFYKQKQFNDYLRVLQRGQEEKERKEARVKMIEKFLAEVKEFGTKHPEMVDSIAHIMELFRFCQQ
ncbi:hypothetical protein FJ208_02185, partial [Candidatus Gribaldobacteria bacterium]|nr:hypothetical protein [Candidatus Gribaldobacteria bacterium]